MNVHENRPTANVNATQSVATVENEESATRGAGSPYSEDYAFPASDGWMRMTWKGDGFPGGHMTSFQRIAWEKPCTVIMPSRKPWFGRVCDRKARVIETVDIHMDGTQETTVMRIGCMYCPNGTDSVRNDDGTWEPLNVQEQGCA